MIETVEIAEAWLYATLSEDATLAGLVSDRVSGTLSPELLVTPYVTFLNQSSRDVSAVGGIRISTDNIYIVKGVAQTSTWDDLVPIANRIDYLIHRPNAVMTQGSGSLTCIRQMVHQMAEITEGMQYRHLGGIYRIRASADV